MPPIVYGSTPAAYQITALFLHFRIKMRNSIAHYILITTNFTFGRRRGLYESGWYIIFLAYNAAFLDRFKLKASFYRPLLKSVIIFKIKPIYVWCFDVFISWAKRWNKENKENKHFRIKFSYAFIIVIFSLKSFFLITARFLSCLIIVGFPFLSIFLSTS